MEFITRKYVRANPDKIFLFGDILLGRGYGGQAAAMRCEPNAIGIPTKKMPTHQTDAFFTDAEFEENKAAIDSAFGPQRRDRNCDPIGWTWNGSGEVA